MKTKSLRRCPRRQLTLRGRIFSSRDIKVIRQVIVKYSDKGRTFISLEVCRELNWRQPNDWLKDRACRDVLKSLAKGGYIKLPRRKDGRRKREQNRIKHPPLTIDTSLLKDLDFGKIQLRQVKGTKDELVWNQIVNKYHYLGFRIFVGRSLKYLVYTDDRIIAALGFCDPAWSIGPRDVAFRKLGYDIDQLRSRGINNGRYLILPWVQVPNLASRIMGIAIKRVRLDWQEYYSVSPLYLETFVDPMRFHGTCYKASNWLHMGESRGYSKSGSVHRNSQAPKLFYIYPFDRRLLDGLINFRSGVHDVIAY